jgi:hypothetical protein
MEKTIEQFRNEILIHMGGLEINPQIDMFKMWSRLKDFVKENPEEL